MRHVPYHFFDDQVEWPVPPTVVLRADRRRPAMATEIRVFKEDFADRDLCDIFVEVVIVALFVAAILLVLVLSTMVRP